MSSKNFYFISGIAAILSALFTIIPTFVSVPDPDAGFMPFLSDLSESLSYLLFILVIWALFRLYSSVARTLSLTALILCIGGTVITIIAIYFYRWILWIPGDFLGNRMPILLFGILMYRNAQLGMPRILGAIGIFSTVLWIIHLIDKFISIIDISGLTFITTPLSFYLLLAWLVWTGVILLSGKLQVSVVKE